MVSIVEFRVLRSACNEDSRDQTASPALVPPKWNVDLSAKNIEIKTTNHVSVTLFNGRALLTTDAELKLIATAAIFGLSCRHSDIGYRAPAAIGMPKAS